MTALPTLKLRVLPTFPSSVISNGTLTITKTAGVYTIAIATAGVSYGNIQNMAASTLLGNPTVAVAAPQEISVGATLTFFNAATLQTNAMSGDVTSPGNSFVTTLAKIQGTAITGTTGTGNVALSDSPNFSTAVLVGRNSVGAGSSDGFVARNGTSAAAGAQQFSPAIRLSGQGWRTNATAQSEQADWTFINETVQGAADPTSNLTFNFQVNAGGYTQKFKMSSGGVFNVATGITVNGAATSGNVLRGNGTNFVASTLAVADLSDAKTGSGSVVLAASPTLTGTPVLGTPTATNLTLANGVSNGLQLTAASGTNGSLAMGAGGSLLFVMGSAVDTFAVNDHSTNTVFQITESTPGTATTAAITAAGNLAILNTTAIPAGGAAAKGYMFSSTSNFGIFFGSGVPTLSAGKGSFYLRSDGSSTSTRAYVNTDGGTTWTNLTTAA